MLCLIAFAPLEGAVYLVLTSICSTQWYEAIVSWDKANALGVHSEIHDTIFGIQRKVVGWDSERAKTRRSTSSWFQISATSNQRRNHRKHLQIEVMQGSGPTTNQGWEQQPRQKGWEMMVHCYSIIIQEKYPQIRSRRPKVTPSLN